MSGWNEKSSGGGGSIVGDVKPIGSTGSNPLIITPSGEEWLKTGVTDDDLIKYPDAPRSTTGAITFEGTDFSFAGEATSFQSMTFDGTFFWGITVSTGTVYRYTALGVFDNFSFTVAEAGGSATGITFDGTDLWVLSNSTNAVFKYDTSGVYSGTSFSVAGETTSVSDITFDGEFFWLPNSDIEILKYTAAGVYTGFSFPQTVGINISAIASDGVSLWLADGNTDEIYIIEFDGTDTGIKVGTTGETANIAGLAVQGDFVWTVDPNSNTAHKYNKGTTVVGSIGAFKQNGQPVHMRIK